MLDVDEALRYVGAQHADGSVRQAAQAAAALVEKQFPPRSAYREFAVAHGLEGVALTGSGVVLRGQLARRMLESSDCAAVIVCTLGVGFDNLIRREQTRDMAQAVLLDACGSAWVEHGCDLAEQELRARHPGKYLTDRFSPGYGDLPLDTQDAILRAVDAQRRLGVYALPSHLINPSKTVTAIIGLSDEIQKARIRGCAYCLLKGRCAYRERGETCGA